MNKYDKTTGYLQVAIIVSTEVIPAWVASVAERLNNFTTSKITLVLVQEARGKGTEEGVGKYASDQSGFGVFKNKLDRLGRVLAWLLRRHGQAEAELSDAFANKFIKTVLPAVDICSLKEFNECNKSCGTKSANQITSESQEFKFDLIVNLGHEKIKREISCLARYGVWTIEHPQCMPAFATLLSGFWESIDECPTTGCVVRNYTTDKARPLVLSCTWASTITASVEDNRRSIAWQAVPLIPRMVAKLHRLGEKKFNEDTRLLNLHPTVFSGRSVDYISNATLLSILLKRIFRRVTKAVETALWMKQWTIFVRRSGLDDIEMCRFVRTLPPKDRFWADPYLVEIEGVTYVFFEEVLRANGRGHIAVGEVSDTGNIENIRVALTAPHHLSHPFVFKHCGQLYMIPESRASKCITLYRCTASPDKWEKVCNLMEDVDASDVTLYFYNSVWWLFVNMSEVDGASTSVELFIFSSVDFPSNTWSPHEQNPVISDSRKARSAGQLFIRNGLLYRPSQDCSYAYGWRFSINHVQSLSFDNYCERSVTVAEPGWESDIIRTHTFNQVEGTQVIDGMIRRPRWW
jgi:hypothetical protein